VELDDRREASATSTSQDEVAPALGPSGKSIVRALVLFLLTVISTLYAGAGLAQVPFDGTFVGAMRALPHGYVFAVPLLAILVTHEFGHYIAARLHRVPASLPQFIPAPFISAFGTFGAIIAMPSRIRSRDALLDIGAAGPLAGLVVALPILAVGIATSHVEPVSYPFIQEGQSLLYVAMKWVIKGPIPSGSDLTMNPLAFAGWTGLLVTTINLVPVGQLDGGHIAYALFGERQNAFARYFHGFLLVAFLYNVVRFVVPAVRSDGDIGTAIGNSAFWLVWFVLLALMRRASGINHPPTDPSELSPVRRWIAALCLALFVLLFMPTPFATYFD
jgi:membrane-associated protease RseP (regulator of RpoE activity)